jgi:hypothetical protein
MSPTSGNPRQNHLLNAIPETEWERFAVNLVPVQLRLGDVIYESGSEQPHVYFPTDSIVSLLYVMEDGSSAEIAIVGNEGLVGISLFMGGGTTPSRAVVQSAEYLGADTIVSCALGADSIAAKVPGRRELAPGSSVGLDWSAADVHFFDAVGGMRRDDVVSLSIH